MSDESMRLVHVPRGNGRSTDGKTAKERLAEGERILADRNKGVPVSVLMDRYGLSHATVYRRIDEAIASRIVPTVDAYREQQNALLDDLMSKWAQQVEAAETIIAEGTRVESMVLVERGMKMRSEALTGQLRVAERRARLMGTDAPVRVDATVVHTTPVDAAVMALVEDIEQRATA